MLNMLALLFMPQGAGHAQERPLSIGMYPSYPPLDMRNPQTNQLEGFDVDSAAPFLNG